jgi:type II secretory pathway pseudopilin PulG
MISILLAFALQTAPQASPTVLSKPAQAALEVFRAKLDGVRDRHRLAGPPESVAGSNTGG